MCTIFNLSSSVWIPESAKLRKWKSSSVNMRRQRAKMRRRMRKRPHHRTLAFATSNFRLRLFSLSWSITYNLMQVLARGLPNALRLYCYGCARQCGGHRAYYECLLVCNLVFWHVVLPVLAKPQYYVLHRSIGKVSHSTCW